MLSYLFIGIFAFVLMGLPILTLIAFIYGMLKINLENQVATNKTVVVKQKTSKFLIPTVIRLAHYGF
ncbi:MAG TPA: hypothetical protein ENK59_00890 [Thioploca sp.]|nr:hypothetical protein [Thioploca sp.]